MAIIAKTTGTSAVKTLDRTTDRVESHARVVIIGGIAGASVFYHLAIEYGWTNIALVERDELT